MWYHQIVQIFGISGICVYTRKVSGITSTLALTIIYIPYKFLSCIMRVNAVLFGSCILCIYLHICLGVPSWFWLDRQLYLSYGTWSGSRASQSRNIEGKVPRIPRERRRTHEQWNLGPNGCLGHLLGMKSYPVILGILIKPNVWYIYLHWSHKNVDMSHTLSVWDMLIQQKIQNLGLL